DFAGAEGKIQIRVKIEEGADNWEPDYEASIHEGNFEESFRRLQNTCIEYFYIVMRDSPFLRYWRAQEVVSCTVVSIYFDLPTPADYDVCDSIVDRLRPRATEVYVSPDSWNEDDFNYNLDKLEALARASFLSSLKTCRLNIWGDDGFPPPSFILNDPGYSCYELWCNGHHVADRIDGFLESFVLDGCANQSLESVCVKWNDDDGPSPTPKKLSKPTKTDTPLPKFEMVMAWIPAVHRVSQCEKHSFVDKKKRKRMEVYKWSVEYDLWSHRRTTHILQCRVESLSTDASFCTSSF
ncbi:hypothetical protein AAVH_31940, partial [Aphelenchoides avenae]